MDNERAALVEARRRATEAAEADLPTFVRHHRWIPTCTFCDGASTSGDSEGSVKAPYLFRRTLGPRIFEGAEVALIAALAYLAGVLTHAVAWAVLR